MSEQSKTWMFLTSGILISFLASTLPEDSKLAYYGVRLGLILMASGLMNLFSAPYLKPIADVDAAGRCRFSALLWILVIVIAVQIRACSHY